MGFTVKKADVITIEAACCGCATGNRLIKPVNSDIFHCTFCGNILKCAYCKHHDTLSFSVTDDKGIFSCRECGTKWVPQKITVVSHRPAAELRVPSLECEHCGNGLLFDNVGNEFCPACIGQDREKKVHKKKRRAFQVKCPECSSKTGISFTHYGKCDECHAWFEVELPTKRLEGARNSINSEEWERFQNFKRMSSTELEMFKKFRSQISEVESSLEDLTSYFRQMSSIAKMYGDSDLDGNLEAMNVALHYLRATIFGVFDSECEVGDDAFDNVDEMQDWSEHDRFCSQKSNRDHSYLLNSYSEVEIEDAEEDGLLVD